MPDRPEKNGSSAPSWEARRSLKPSYRTRYGSMYHARFEDFLASPAGWTRKGKAQLIFTSPPFPLNRKKKYGNETGEDYIDWLATFAQPLSELVADDGSIVMELGNAWEPGKPVMSTLALRALLKFMEEGRFNLCQQFVCHNPARLPTPAQWVNIERIRVKDSFTHLWWMSPSERPKASNKRVLTEYSGSMQKLLDRGEYNDGKRPSQHRIGERSFLKNHGGAIPPNVLEFSNTLSTDSYRAYCQERELTIHPARMPSGLAEFFIKFLTEEGDLVVDPFAGSNVTGAAAEELKRRWVGVEADEDYVKGSRGRFPADEIEQAAA